MSRSWRRKNPKANTQLNDFMKKGWFPKINLLVLSKDFLVNLTNLSIVIVISNFIF